MIRADILKAIIPLSQAYKNLLVGHLAYEVLEMETALF